MIVKHWGHARFNRKLFKPVKNRWTKPEGGFWGSPVDSCYSWWHWNQETHLRSLENLPSFMFELNGKILTIKSKEDLVGLPIYKLGPQYTGSDEQLKQFYEKFDDMLWLDFESIANEYDAILFIANAETQHILVGWDCDSVLVLNPDCVEEL